MHTEQVRARNEIRFQIQVPLAGRNARPCLGNGTHPGPRVSVSPR